MSSTKKIAVLGAVTGILLTVVIYGQESAQSGIFKRCVVRWECRSAER